MMRCYSHARREKDAAYLEKLYEQLDAIQASYLEISSGMVEAYRFDDGAGSMSVKKSDTSKILNDMNNLKRLIDWYERKLGGCLNVDIVQRRRLYRGIGVNY